MDLQGKSDAHMMTLNRRYENLTNQVLDEKHGLYVDCLLVSTVRTYFKI